MKDSSKSHVSPSANFSDGFLLHPIRERAARATPSQWHDVVVESVNGLTVNLRDFNTGDKIPVWHHESLESVLSSGMPVSFHEKYNVLFIGSDQYFSISRQ